MRGHVAGAKRYALPLAKTEACLRGRRGGRPPTMNAYRDRMGQVIAEGLRCLCAVTSPDPSAYREQGRLRVEGENLERQTQRTPEERPPRGLLRAIGEWLRSVKGWFKAHVMDHSHPDLEAKIDALAEDMQELRASVDARFNAVDARFDAVDARFDAVDARFDAMDVQFGAVNKSLIELRSHYREIRSVAYGPKLERCVCDDLPGFLAGYYAPILRTGKVKVEVLHRERSDARTFIADWCNGESTTGIANPLRSDIILLLYPEGKPDNELMVVCEISMGADARDVRRAARRAEWLSDCCNRPVVPLVVGAAWKEDIARMAAAERVPCLQPVVSWREMDDGSRQMDEIEDWMPQDGFRERIDIWSQPFVQAALPRSLGSAVA